MLHLHSYSSDAQLIAEVDEGGNVTLRVRNRLENGGYVISYIELPSEQVALLIDHLEKERNGKLESN